MPGPQPLSPHMHTALRLARRHLGQTWPNPSVGCVIVQGEKVVGEGITQPGGRPHAETVALSMAGERARGATAFVTLEPCAHHGQTPPCADALVDAGIARCVIACVDPDPRVAGQGIARLQEAGIEVLAGVCEPEARILNAGFFSRITRGRPWVTAKVAASLDGRIALANGKSQWITGALARQYGHALRTSHDAVMVGTNTVITDNPRLDCRLPGYRGKQPVRVVLDRQGRIPATAAVFDTATQPTWLMTAQHRDIPGVTVLPVPDFSPVTLLETLGRHGLTRLMVEGGGQLLASLIRHCLVDELHWITAPKLLGGDGLPAVQGLGLSDLPAAWQVVERRPLGEDTVFVLRYREGFGVRG